MPDSIPPSSLPPPPEQPRPATRTSKRRPQARLRAISGDQAVADWASLFGDLGRSSSQSPTDDPPVEWRVHDRTHLEFAIDYPVTAARSQHTWEAFFFLPESFRLHENSYDKKAIYDDLWSYVRYAVPQLPFYQLAERRAGGPLARAREALAASAGAAAGSAASALAMQRLRLYACLVRAAGVAALREIEREVEAPEPSAAQLRALVGPFVATCSAVAGALRALIDETAARSIPEEARIAARWTDEDVSMVLETLCATLGIAVENRAKAVPALRDYAESLAADAIEQARHRRDRGYGSLGSSDASERDIEHLEFRRHVLKRFTSSVLWLSLEVHEAAAWVVHTLYAFAAAVAMAFALAAGFRATPMTESFFRYAVVVVIAYAVKDRLKAFLQSVFAGWIARRFPDRKWAILDRERGRRVGSVHERAAFLPFDTLPAEVLSKRRSTREHPLEEHARPERVLWHHKTVSIAPRQKGNGNVDFPMMTEIFRLNLRRWLSHTDDPNRKIVFADPGDARVYSATARRVYNVNVVYRLSTSGVDSPWHRLRMVVSRKGIERIDAIC
ncbi:MAG: hypothetical protein ACMG6S_25855 [Byssovorax sp.]